jgi:hypothetical protein
VIAVVAAVVILITVFVVLRFFARKEWILRLVGRFSAEFSGYYFSVKISLFCSLFHQPFSKVHWV